MMNPVSGSLNAAGDTVVAQLAGDPGVLCTIQGGTWQSATIVVEVLPLVPAGVVATWSPFAEVDLGSDVVVAGGVVVLTGGNQRSFSVPTGGVSAVRIRAVNPVVGGPVVGVIGPNPFPGPGGSGVQLVAGTVGIGPLGQQPKAASVPVVQAADAYQAVAGQPGQAPLPGNPATPGGGQGLLQPVPVLDQQVLLALNQCVDLLGQMLHVLQIMA